MSMTTAEPKTEATEERKKQLPAIAAPRLPYHPAIQERFGIDMASWRALVEAVYPNATSINSVIMALSYCRARKLDPFKRVVHIVPIWNKELGRMIDTVWPGIGELRTTAFRTGEYAGRGATVFGPDITQKVGSVEMTYPEWAQCTVFRMVKGQRVEFAGPRVYWVETYATVKRNDDTPNDMWQTRPRGQIDKCAEAAALRAAFPEEIGGDYIPEEVQHSGKGGVVEATAAVRGLDELAEELEGRSEAEPSESSESSDTPLVADKEEPPAEFDLAGITERFTSCRNLGAVTDLVSELEKIGIPEEQKLAIDALTTEARQRITESRQQRKPAGATS